MAENFDRERFTGTWYEIYVDLDQYIWDSKECSRSTYSPQLMTVDGMYHSRSYFSSMWNSEVSDYPVELTKYTNWEGSTLQYSGFFYDGEHIIIDTDYDNYAVAYGCDNYLLGIFHSRWATFLTRIDYAEAEFVEAAKSTMR
jgi:hypothetical protein